MKSSNLTRRLVQFGCLALFLAALGAVFFDLTRRLSVEYILGLDPLLAGGSLLAGRAWAWALLPGLAVLALAPLLGRAFCGWVCPLGATLDLSDALGAKPRPDEPLARWRPVKYWLLAGILGAGLLGVSLVFLASPLSLVTRFYALLVAPVAALAGDQALRLLQPLAESLDWTSLTLAKVRTARFDTQAFVLVFFAALFLVGRLAPRLWCRYLCPAGALLALFSFRPALRRRVSDKCVACGRCQRACPMGAIPEDPLQTSTRDCLVCRTCQEVCPTQAIAFTAGPSAPAEGLAASRRQFLTAGLAGAGAAAVSLTGLTSAFGKPGPGQVQAPDLVRPPAARPEADFLARCVRCGECLAACPTNTLQPIWLAAGWTGLFSPALTPRRGPCDPNCHRCAQVCPTQAMRLIGPEERLWAKAGTAVINRRRCLAWEQDKKCLVCDEVCPYGAVIFSQEPGLVVPVPHVDETKCAGCGYCEHFCPIQNQAAITVSPQGALRLAQGSYREQAQSQGLSLSLKAKDGTKGQPPASPGGEKTDGPAPGFTD